MRLLVPANALLARSMAPKAPYRPTRTPPFPSWTIIDTLGRSGRMSVATFSIRLHAALHTSTSMYTPIQDLSGRALTGE